MILISVTKRVQMSTFKQLKQLKQFKILTRLMACWDRSSHFTSVLTELFRLYSFPVCRFNN